MSDAILKQLQAHADAGANELQNKTDVSNVIEALSVAMSDGATGINAQSLLVVAYTFYLQEIDIWEANRCDPAVIEGPPLWPRQEFEERAYDLAQEINMASQGYTA